MDAGDWAAAATMHETQATAQIASVRISLYRSGIAERPQPSLWYYKTYGLVKRRDSRRLFLCASPVVWRWPRRSGAATMSRRLSNVLQERCARSRFSVRDHPRQTSTSLSYRGTGLTRLFPCPGAQMRSTRFSIAMRRWELKSSNKRIVRNSSTGSGTKYPTAPAPADT
jgi:hypothetical protein